MTGATADELWPLVRDYHYSKRMSAKVQYAFAIRTIGGLFGETGEPIAGITYSHPINRHFPQGSIELSRLIRKPEYQAPLSNFVAWSLRWLRANTSKSFVLSYADSGAGHHGGIYQALGFKYIGANKAAKIGFSAPDGSFIHARTCNGRYGTNSNDVIARVRPDWVPVFGEPKHLYIFPLRQKWASIARQRGWQSLPYPKPSAARPSDAPVPSGASEVQPLGAAPCLFGEVA